MGSAESSPRPNDPTRFHTQYIRPPTGIPVMAPAQLDTMTSSGDEDAHQLDFQQKQIEDSNQVDNSMDPNVLDGRRDVSPNTSKQDNHSQMDIDDNLTESSSPPDPMEVDDLTVAPDPPEPSEADIAARQIENGDNDQSNANFQVEDGDDEFMPPYFKLHFANRSRWDSEQDPECIKDRKEIAEAVCKIKKTSMPEPKRRPVFKTSKRSEISQQIRFSQQQHRDLQAVMPNKQLKPHHYKIVVMASESARVLSKKTLKNLMWYKGWRKTSILTVHHMYCHAAVISKEDYCMMSCGRVIPPQTMVEEMNILGDQLIVLHCVPTADAARFQTPVLQRVQNMVHKALTEETAEQELVGAESVQNSSQGIHGQPVPQSEKMAGNEPTSLE